MPLFNLTICTLKTPKEMYSGPFFFPDEATARGIPKKGQARVRNVAGVDFDLRISSNAYITLLCLIF